MGDARQDIAELRGLLKDFLPRLSVRKGRGTAWGWIDIGGSAANGYFTDEEALGLRTLGLSPGANACVISPEDREYWLGKLRELNYEARQAGCCAADHLRVLVERRGGDHDNFGITATRKGGK